MHEIVYIAYACELMWMYVEFRDEFVFLGGKNVKPEKIQFYEKG